MRRAEATDLERGQSLVEFALMFPIIVLLMVGVFDMGRIVFINNSLSDGARHAARHAIINPRDIGVLPGDPDYCQRIDDAMRSAILGLELSDFTVTYQVITAADAVSGQVVLCDMDGATGAAVPLTASPGDRVVVVLESGVVLATPLIAAASGQQTFNLRAESTMQVTFAPSTP